MNDRQAPELDDMIKDAATRHKAPAGLREAIVKRLHEVKPDSTKIPRHKASWAWWGAVGAAFACGAVLSWSLALVQMAPDPLQRNVQEVVSGHVRSLMGNHLEDVASSDQHTVKPWFGGKLDYSPPVHDFASAGFPLIGGRLDYIEQRAVAALVYQRRQHTINLFVWPALGGTHQKVRLLSRQGFNVASWADSGMQFWAVSDLNAEELQAFVELSRTSDED